MKTNIINQTKQSFQLKEGNAGAFRLIKQLGDGDNHSFTLDPNATYREYVVATGNTGDMGDNIFFSSDDFNVYKAISIVGVDEKGRPKCEYTHRKGRGATSSGLVDGVEPTRETWYKKFIKWTGVRGQNQ